MGKIPVEWGDDLADPLSSWKISKDTEASAETLPAYAPCIKAGVPFAFSPTGKASQQDLETAIQYSSYAPPQYSVEERDPSFVSRDFLEIDSTISNDDIESAYSYPIDVEIAEVPPCHHRPFTAPSILPLENSPYTTVHGSGISIMIQTESTVTSQ